MGVVTGLRHMEGFLSLIFSPVSFDWLDHRLSAPVSRLLAGIDIAPGSTAVQLPFLAQELANLTYVGALGFLIGQIVMATKSISVR